MTPEEEEEEGEEEEEKLNTSDLELDIKGSSETSIDTAPYPRKLEALSITLCETEMTQI